MACKGKAGEVLEDEQEEEEKEEEEAKVGWNKLRDWMRKRW